MTVQKMLRAVLPILLASLALLSCPVFGQKMALPPPVEPAFDQALARVSRNGDLEVQTMHFKAVYAMFPETYTVQQKIAQQVEDPTTKQPKTVYKSVPVMKTRMRTEMKMVFEKCNDHLSWEEVSATEIGGGPVEPQDLRERLSRPTLVLITHDGQPVPESFAVLFKTGTLVLQPHQVQTSPAVLPPVGAPPFAPGEILPPAPIPVPVPRAAPAPGPAPALPPAPAPASAPPEAPPELPKLPDAKTDLAPDDFSLPNAPPLFRLARIDERGQFALRSMSSTERALTYFMNKVEKKLVDDREVAVTVCQPINVIERYAASATTLVPSELVTGRTIEGKPLADMHLKALKQREIAVIVSRDGRPADPFWLQNIKPKMLMLMPPASQVPAPPPVE